MEEEIKVVPILSLPEIEDTVDCWIPATTKTGGTTVTGRYSLEKLVEYVQTLQLERRYPIVLVGVTFEFLCPEVTTLYKVITQNVSKLEYSIDNQATWKPLATTGAINAELPIGVVVHFRIEKQTFDPKAYVTFSGKAKI